MFTPNQIKTPVGFFRRFKRLSPNYTLSVVPRIRHGALQQVCDSSEDSESCTTVQNFSS